MACTSKPRPLAALAFALAVLAGGCASKKHVKASIDPLERRVGELETRSAKSEGAISDLERNLSQTDERSRGAESRASQAALEAARANERAAQSSQQAEAAAREAAAAKALAEAEKARLAELDERLANRDNYQQLATENVLFPFGSYALTSEAKRQLDATAAKILDHRRYVIEVQGFTDGTGSPEFNLELSRNRADAVVQYLTLQHRIPLHRISVQGVGSEAPVADNNTVTGRKQNRRVEVTLYTPKVN